MSLAILGGTFDPVHLGHLALAGAARERFGIERVLLLPARRPPHKGDRVVTSFAHRMAMVELACRDRDGIEASDLEGARSGPSYTVETLARFRASMAADDPLFFIMGSDSLADLPTWREPERILSLANLIVVPRPGIDRAEAVAALDEETSARVMDAGAPPAPCGTIYWTEVPPHRISGSEIRKRAREGADLSGLVPGPVAEYISRYHLYGGAQVT